MANPAFIVEGRMEQKIIARLCPGQPVRLINCNGDSVAVVRMCDFIETQIRSMGNRHYPVIIIFDREKRIETAAQLQQAVKNELHKRGLEDHDLRVFVADREAEDWLLKDKDAICDHYAIPRDTRELKGKGGLEKLIGDVTAYHETSTGVLLFDVVSKKKLAEMCTTFASLMSTVEELGCDVGFV